MLEDLNRLKAQLQVVLEHIRKGEVHPDPEWSWDLELVCLEHDIPVMAFAVENGYTDFNTAVVAYIDMICE